MLTRVQDTSEVSQLVGPDGAPITKKVRHLTADQARIIREYVKKVLVPLGLREALFCNECFRGKLSDGTRIHINDANILVECRCTDRVYSGVT